MQENINTIRNAYNELLENTIISLMNSTKDYNIKNYSLEKTYIEPDKIYLCYKNKVIYAISINDYFKEA